MVVPGGRPRRRVPAIVIVVCWKWVGRATATSGGRACRTPTGRPRDRPAPRRDRSATTSPSSTVGRAGRRARAAPGARRRRRPRRARSTPPPSSPARRWPRPSRRSAAGADWVAVRRPVHRPRQRVGAGVRRRRARRRPGARARRRARRRRPAVRATRRLDGGRREVLDVAAPAVLSVEGAVARLRRASLRRRAGRPPAPIEVARRPRRSRRGTPTAVRRLPAAARALAAPTGAALDRVRLLTDAGRRRTTHELATLDPDAAARASSPPRGVGLSLIYGRCRDAGTRWTRRPGDRRAATS